MLTDQDIQRIADEDDSSDERWLARELLALRAAQHAGTKGVRPTDDRLKELAKGSDEAAEIAFELVNARVELALWAGMNTPRSTWQAGPPGEPNGELVYLASPYNHPDPAIREQRFQAVCKAAAVLMGQGRFIFCPIAHTHPIALNGLPKGWDYWERYDRAILSRCTEVIVLQLDGWKEGEGVSAEVSIAVERGLPVSYMHAPLEPQAVPGKDGDS